MKTEKNFFRKYMISAIKTGKNKSIIFSVYWKYHVKKFLYAESFPKFNFFRGCSCCQIEGYRLISSSAFSNGMHSANLFFHMNSL